MPIQQDRNSYFDDLGETFILVKWEVCACKNIYFRSVHVKNDDMKEASTDKPKM